MNATATLLQNGKVLIAGGSPEVNVPYRPVLASAELYDPATGTFTLTGSMRTARTQATATLLPDGRVLIAGGRGCANPKKCFMNNTFVDYEALASAELYDPATGKFTATGSMSTPRENGSAILLADGKVLMLNGGPSLVELYDPATGKFTKRGSLSYGYPNTVAALLPNGRVLVVNDAAEAELFDLATGMSTSVSIELPRPPASITNDHRYYQIPQTATTLKDGRVLVTFWTGFSDYSYSYPPYSESGLLATYDPVSNSMAQIGWISDPPRWSDFRATLLADGRVLFTGGAAGPDTAGDGSTSAWAALYDPAVGLGLTDAKMGGARSHHTATLLSDGSVLIAGGTDEADPPALSSAELFEP